MTTMTPEQFFDALDELFGTDDGYVNHLQRIKELKTSNQQYIAMFNAVVESEGEKVDKIDKLERENKELRQQIETLRYQLKDEVAGWSPTSSAEPKMDD